MATAYGAVSINSASDADDEDSTMLKKRYTIGSPADLGATAQRPAVVPLVDFFRRNPKLAGICAFYFMLSMIVCMGILPVIDEDFGDVLYFTVVTLSTVGYGDITPTTDAGKIFIALYAFVGVILFSAIIAVMTQVGSCARALSACRRSARVRVRVCAAAQPPL